MSAPTLTIDALPVLLRREIEARVLAPFVDDLAAAFGRDAVVDVLRGTITRIAREQGHALAARHGSALGGFATATAAWTAGNALELDVLEQSDDCYAFNVTRCGYAEMYRRLGIPELGTVLSCHRDAALIDGYNAEVTLTRPNTLLQGGSCCDFRYARTPASDTSGT